MYQALYRKYRPRSFDDVAGQEHITGTLKNQVSSGRLSHAYLFIGTRGTGKTTCAKILAKAVNCENPVNGNPCGICAACRGIDDGSVMDVVEIDAASNNSVDNVRELRDEAVFSPASVKKRVYIIDEVHMLSTAAFNALLKILEEPPEHLIFILATTELRKVPATILSRCQRYSFRRITAPVLTERLNYIARQEKLDLKPDAAELLARLADGSFRDGISLLDQCSGAPVIDTEAVLSALGLAGNLRTAELLSSVAQRDTAAALTAFDSLWRDGKDPAGLLSDLCTLMRDLLILSVAPKGGAELISGGYDRETLRSFEGKFTPAELINAMDTIQNALGGLRENPSPRTSAELCLVSLCDPRLTEGLPEIRARLSRLEERGVAAPIAPPTAETRREPPSALPEAESITPTVKSAPDVPPIAAAPTSANNDEPPFDMDEPPLPDEPPFDMDEPPIADGPDNAPVSAPKPEPEPVPEDKPSPPAPADGEKDTWRALAARVKPSLPLGHQRLLDDPLQITGSLNGEELTLSIASGFAFGMFNKPDILSAFQRAAAALTGGSCAVRVAEMDTTAAIEKRSVEELSRFPGVSYKN